MTEQVGIQVCEVERIRGLEKLLSSDLPTLYRRAYRLLGNAVDAEDLAAYTHLDQFKGQSQLGHLADFHRAQVRSTAATPAAATRQRASRGVDRRSRSSRRQGRSFRFANPAK